jgi:hypothetical protein
MELLIGKLTMKDPSERFYHWGDICHAVSLIIAGETIGVTFDKSRSSIKVSEQEMPEPSKPVEVVETNDVPVVEDVVVKKKVVFNKEHAQKHRDRHRESLIPDAPIPATMHFIMIIVVVSVWLLVAGIVNYRYLSAPVFDQPQIRLVVDKIMPEK